ncbi:MAG: VOC family protein [Planctomycetota bacterium]
MSSASGFELLVDGEVAIFRIGGTGFILQRYEHREVAQHLMLQLMVDDLDAWWRHITSLDLASRFGTSMLRAPAMQPWGLRVAFLADPCGVLWHIAERRPGAVQD